MLVSLIFCLYERAPLPLTLQMLSASRFKVADVAQRLGGTTQSLYTWTHKFGKAEATHRDGLDQNAEIRRMKLELFRITEGGGTLKKVTAYFAKGQGQGTGS